MEEGERRHDDENQVKFRGLVEKRKKNRKAKEKGEQNGPLGQNRLECGNDAAREMPMGQWTPRKGERSHKTRGGTIDTLGTWRASPRPKIERERGKAGLQKKRGEKN